MEEEELRDLLLGMMNANYPGTATGETFRKLGKTDISFRVDAGYVLICECKFWHGAEEYANALDQLFRYVTWRENFGVLIHSCTRKDMTRSIAPPYRAYAEVLASPRLRRLLLVWFFAQMGMSAQGIVAPYMARYVFARPELMGVLPALFIGPLAASIPVWVSAAGRFGPRRVWLVAMAAGVGSYALLTAVPVGHLGVTAVLLAVCGFATGATGSIGPSLFATLVDEDAARSGERREGVIFAASQFSRPRSEGLARWEHVRPSSPSVRFSCRLRRRRAPPLRSTKRRRRTRRRDRRHVEHEFRTPGPGTGRSRFESTPA